MSARALLAAACYFAVVALADGHTAFAAAVAAPPPGYKPLATTDEAGVWQLEDQAEKIVQQSPQLIRDEALNAYVKTLICKLSGPQCTSLRVYISDIPIFNAECAANGMVIVWSGLLLRTENEAQLAFVLGHELTHYLKRHQLQSYEYRRNTADALAFLSLGLAGISVGTGINFGPTMSTVQQMAVGAYFAYSRRQEDEADAGGFQLAVAHGYDPREGAIIWRNIEDEDNANPRRKAHSLFYSDHPTNKARIVSMTKLASEMAGQQDAQTLEIEAYRRAVLPHRAEWLQEELNRGQFDESVFLIGRMLKSNPDSGELNYFLAEAYRRRNAKGDSESAMASYRASIASTDAPTAAFRGLGLVALKAGNKDAARESFQRYLDLAPAASDRTTIQYYLTTIGVAQ